MSAPPKLWHDCRSGKIGYTRKAAMARAIRMTHKHGWYVRHYRCGRCKHWHVGHAQWRPARRP